ncbi:MAG: VOC family protein [Ferruginibacter sp.]
MEIKAIHHVAILTDDYERSKDFYINVLGFVALKETYRAERDSYKLDLEINGQYQIELFSFPDFKERASFPEQKGLRHLAFAVENIGQSVDELIAKGVEVQGIRIDELTNKKFCFFNDPNGQPLELYEI